MAAQHMTNKNNRQQPSKSSEAQQRGGRTAPIADQAQHYLERGNERLRDMVEDHEGQSVLLALALGFGVGIAIGYAIGGPSQSASSRWIDRSTAENLGRKLMERMDQILPTAISGRLHG
jgi:hypothetical protein